MQHDVGAAFGLVALFERIFGRAVATPMLCGRIGVRFCKDFDLFRYHKCRIEAQAEMADDGVGVVFVFIQKFGSARECNLIDVLFDFVGRHAHAAVADGEGFLFGIEFHLHLQIAHLAFVVAHRGQCFQFLRSIDSVRHQFAQKNLMIAVQKFLDDGKNVVRRYTNITFHNCIFFVYHFE